MRIAPLTPGNVRAFDALFEACGSSCFCQYWHFEGTKSDWLTRCFDHPADNRDAQTALVEGGGLEARGLLAFDGSDSDASEHAIGWMKLAPRATLSKLRRQGAYRPLDLGSDDGVWSIGCFLVHPQRRRRGVARALVAAADAHVRAWGGACIETYPHRASYALRDEEAFMGPESLFVKNGYVAVHDEGPYPVYRRRL